MGGSNMNVGHIGRSLCTWDSATISKIFLCCSDWVMFSLDFTVCQSYPLTLQFPIANVYEFVCVSICVHVYTCACMCTCVQMCVSLCAHVCMYIVFLSYFFSPSVFLNYVLLFSFFYRTPLLTVLGGVLVNSVFFCLRVLCFRLYSWWLLSMVIGL